MLFVHEAQVVSAALNESRTEFLSGNREAGHREQSHVSNEINFAVPPPAVDKLVKHAGGSDSRRLQISTVENWEWPAQTVLTLESTRGDEVKVETSNNEVVIMAGMVYQKIEIKASGVTFGTPHNQAKIKLVTNLATRDKCHLTEFDVPMGVVVRQNCDPAEASQALVKAIPSVMGTISGPLSLDNSGSTLSKTFNSGNCATPGELSFMFGGIYKLCYTPDGSFGGGDLTEYRNNVLEITLRVIGVTSPCSTPQVDRCIEDERWECSFAYRAESKYNSPCVFDLQSDGGRQPGWGVTPGAKSMMTWTASYGADGTTNAERICADSIPEQTILDTTSTGLFIKLDTTTGATMPPVKTTYTGTSFTMSACYCPNYSADTGVYCDQTSTTACCDDYQEYIQQFGVIYFWSIRITDSDDVASTTPYMRVIPQQKFTLRVDCPPGGGCKADDANRVKFIDYKMDNDRPTWDKNHGCRTTTGETGRAVWPSISDAMTLGGGTSVAYKAWQTKQVKLNMPLSARLDVCYCNGACENPNNFFRVGSVWASDAFAFAKSISPGSTTKFIKYVNEGGSVTLFGGIKSGTTLNPYDSNKYSGKALLNVISFDRDKLYGIGDNKQTLEDYFSYSSMMPTNFQTQMDAECQREDYQPTLVAGAWSKLDAKTYIAQVDTDENAINQYLTFSGTYKDQKLHITRSGVVGICYCAMLSTQDACLDPAFWFYAGRVTIHGPVGGQSWTFPTNIIVKIELEGWGFTAKDKLRIVPAETSCTDNTGNPSGDTTFRIGCPSTPVPLPCSVDPIRCDGCKYANAMTSLPLNVLTSESSSTYISQVAVTNIQSTLSFTQPITNVLSARDIITLDINTVLNRGQTVTQMNDADKFAAHQLAADVPFQDEAGETYMVGHRVSQSLSNGVVQTQQLTIPIGWPSDGQPEFTFVNSQGKWTRHNRIETPLEIKGSQAKEGLRVCWGVDNSGTKYYSEAGLLSFQDPPEMNVKTINLSSKGNDPMGAKAPIIISFQTHPQMSAYAEAKNAATTLMLRFKDVGTNGKLNPLFAGDSPPGSSAEEIDADNEVLETAAKQWVCGRLFNELWSKDTEGFPMPSGCYFGKTLRDRPPTDQSTLLLPLFRELYLSFPAGSGLKQNTDYQIVINTEFKNIVQGSNLLDLYSLCVGPTGCARPYQVFEKGTTEASSGTLAGAAAGAHPSFNSQYGFQLQRGNPVDGLLDLSTMSIVQARLRGQDDNSAIQKNCNLRIFMWPLTLWDLGTGCSAECVPYHANTKKCDGTISCTTEEVVIGSDRKNIVRLKLPADMDSITSTIQHTVKVTGLTLPVAGFFASRVGSQVTMPDDSRPSYTTSYGFLMKQADPGMTTGRLVLSDRTGYGPKPFAADTDNTLYLRISFGATVWNNGQADAAYISITLPDGYTCKVPDDGAPDLTLPVFTNDIDNDGYYDSNRGSLSVATADGTWANSAGKRCVYEPKQYNAIFAGMVVFIKVTVDNPGAPLQKIDTKNVWSVKLSCKGANTITQNAADMPEQTFITLGEAKELNSDFWAGNAAVLSSLIYETLQPTDFRITTDTYTDSQWIHVFFRTTQDVGRNGYVVLDAPDGYDFAASCQQADLPSKYYAYRGVGNDAVYQLKNMAQCTGLRSPSTATTYNRARIMVGGIIGPNLFYGFRLRVKHPKTYSVMQHKEWYLWTQDSNRYGLEGSRGTVRFNKKQVDSEFFYEMSYGTYLGNFLDSFNIEVQGTQPYSITSQDSDVTVYPITFDKFTDTSLRITAPYGYVWSDCASTFQPRMNMSTIDFPAPMCEDENVMVWPQLQFTNDQTYGFMAKMKVPDFSPVTSSDSFFVEFGYNKEAIADRMMAGVLPAPNVRSFTNCAVSYASNLQGYLNNLIEFSFEMQTVLWENEGIVIKGDANTRNFAITCPPKMLPGSPLFPSDMRCVPVDSQDGLPQILLKAMATPIPPGYYRFEMPAINPGDKVLVPGNWKFGSYKNVNQYPSSAQIDNFLEAEGFAINELMPDARLMTLTQKQFIATKRNDRPGKRNELIFRFQLRDAPPATLPLLLRGPRGFEFEEDCLMSIMTAKNDVFGPNTESTWPPDITEWPAQFAPSKCTGLGRVANIQIPAGLGRRNLYVFRIAVVKNPDTTPEFNKWTIDYKGESSDPFEGFTIWTFTNLLITPVSMAKSPTGANVARTISPVALQFRPWNSIPFKCPSCATGGMVRVTSPNRFEFAQVNGECNAMLFANSGDSAEFPKDTIRCTVSPTLRTKLFLELVGGDKVIEGSRDYTMVVEVYNPTVIDAAEPWALDSFNVKESANTNNDQIALDESVVPGFEVSNVLNVWTVNNKYNSYNGKALVNDVEVVMQFPDSLKDEDEIFIHGPDGFDLMGNPELKECKDFRWPPNFNPFPGGTRPPTCSCFGSGATLQCIMRFFITEYKDPAYPQNQNIIFLIATENPAKTPFIMSNFWKCRHVRAGITKSSHVYPSWEINPQLEAGEVHLVGANKRAGAMSDITISFMPVSSAATLKVEALHPTEFDFGKATVPMPFYIDERSERGIIIINRASIIEDRVFILTISSVKLGRGGGQTMFNLITYKDETMTVKMDEKLEYTGGFRLPGKIDVEGKTLKSKYANQRQLYPVKSLFQPRVNELAYAEFILMFSQPVNAGQVLIIACTGDGSYELRAAPFVIIGKERVDASVENAPGTLHTLQATLKPGRPSTEVALQADTPYTVTFSCIPKQGTNDWMFETSDSTLYPTNTNDGITTGFKPVEWMELTVAHERSPPRAIIPVTLNVNARSAVVLELLIIAPPSFIFPPSGCGTMCQAGQALGATMRRTATIASPTGEPLTTSTWIINIQTPEETPGGAEFWYIEARGQGRGTTTGWGYGAGFKVNQMVSGVSYAGVASLRSAQISFHFTLEVDSGSEIAVEPPTNYILSCSTEGALKQGSLPGSRPGCTDEPLVLMLSATLTRGEYSFAVAVDLPATQSNPNTFNIIIRNRDNQVVDAAYSRPGVELHTVPVTSPTLSWSRAEPGQNSVITIGIDFESDYNQVKALLITFPQKFIHAIQRPTEVQNLNRRFPVSASQSGGWAEWGQDWIRIYLDDSDDSTVIAADSYSFNFPVLVPVDNVPRVNVWYFSLCNERTCQTPSGRGVIASFPMQGFALNEVSPASLQAYSSANVARRRSIGFVSLAVSVLCVILMTLSL
jgi:hypothetical protein